MMSNTSSLCFSTVVFGDYKKYLPFYIYSALKSYPGASVRLFLDGPPETAVARDIEILRRASLGNIVLDTEWVRQYMPAFVHYDIIGGGAKLLRWLVPGAMMQNESHILFSDVDIFILREKRDLLSFHCDRIERTGLPFSNRIRKNQRRLTGIHFVTREDYYATLGTLASELLRDSSAMRLFLNGIGRDEEFLYKLISSCMDLSRLTLEPYVRPWHGLHLGAARGDTVDKAKFAANSSLSRQEAKLQLYECLLDPVFRSLKTVRDDKSFDNYLHFLGVKPPLIYDLSRLIRRCKYKATSLLRKAATFYARSHR